MTREYTIHLHKLVHGRSFKKRAPHAVKSVVEFARKSMGTKDVRLDPKLNQALWAQGIKTVPHRIRVKLERKYRPCDLCRSVCLIHISGKRNDEENAKEKLYTYASHVPVNSFKAGSPPLPCDCSDLRPSGPPNDCRRCRVRGGEVPSHSCTLLSYDLPINRACLWYMSRKHDQPKLNFVSHFSSIPRLIYHSSDHSELMKSTF